MIMKKINIILALIVTFFFASCEEVVDVPLDTAAPRLVVEATIYWQKETAGNNQSIKLTTTNDFYSNVVPPANDAVTAKTLFLILLNYPIPACMLVTILFQSSTKLIR